MFLLKKYQSLTQLEHVSILELRNSERVRSMSLNSNTISLGQHMEWVSRLNENPSRAYWAVFKNDKLCGNINLHFDSNMFSWGISFNEGLLYVPIIFAYMLLKLVFKSDKLKQSKVEVLLANKKAIKMNTTFGYSLGEKFTHEGREFTTMFLSKEGWLKALGTSQVRSIEKIWKNHKVDYSLIENFIFKLESNEVSQ